MYKNSKKIIGCYHNGKQILKRYHMGHLVYSLDNIRLKVIIDGAEPYYIGLEDVFTKYQDGSLHKGIRVAK